MLDRPVTCEHACDEDSFVRVTEKDVLLIVSADANSTIALHPPMSSLVRIKPLEQNVLWKKLA